MRTDFFDEGFATRGLFASSFCEQPSQVRWCYLRALTVETKDPVSDKLGNWMILLGRILSGLILMSLVNAALADDYSAPRGPGGKPDLNGVWQVFNRANYDIEPHAARASLAMVKGDLGPLPAPSIVAIGPLGSVPGGLGVVMGDKLPYSQQGLAKKLQNQAAWLTSDPEIKCYLPGIPRANYMPYPFQILHSESALFFSYEYAGAVRNIHLTDPGEAPIDSWMGQSYGYWDGDTLVIEVTGQNDRTWFDRAGNHHSDVMKVTERYTPTSDYTMDYQVAIEDDKTFTAPWQMQMTLYRRTGADAQIQQFKCVEFVEELMYGSLRKGVHKGADHDVK